MFRAPYLVEWAHQTVASTKSSNGATASLSQQGGPPIEGTGRLTFDRNRSLPRDTNVDKQVFQYLTPWAKRDLSPQQVGQPEPFETGIADTMGQPREQKGKTGRDETCLFRSGRNQCFHVSVRTRFALMYGIVNSTQGASQYVPHCRHIPVQYAGTPYSPSPKSAAPETVAIDSRTPYFQLRRPPRLFRAFPCSPT